MPARGNEVEAARELEPQLAKRGRGVVIEDVDGNEFLDFSAGIAVTSTGHCHPEVVAAIQKQAGELIHMSGTDFYYEELVALAEKLSQLAPGDAARRVSFGNSGAEANEAAIKMARKAKPGGELQVHGSGALLRWLLEHDLVDELNLRIYPVIVGDGLRLFAEHGQTHAMELVESRSTASGVMLQTYRPIGRATFGNAGD